MVRALVLAAVTLVSAASWTVSHKLTTKKGGDVVSVSKEPDGGIRLAVEDHPNVQPAPARVVVFLAAHEALELARIIVTTIPPDAGPSFDDLADESVEKTDAEFCAKAKTVWEQRAFCRHLRGKPAEGQ